MKIAVMGAGGVGGYVGARLQAAGQQIAFVARGAHLAALRAEGLRLESPAGQLHLPTVEAADDPAAIGPVDLVLFAVKLRDTDAAAASLGPLLGPETRVLTLQNGVDSVGMIGRRVPQERVRGGAIYVSAVIARPGVIASPGGPNRIVADAAKGDPVIAEFVAACNAAPGIEAVATDAIDRALWEKFIVLCAVSGATALLRSPMGAILGHPETKAFLARLVAEGLAVGAAVGHPMPDGAAEGAMARFATLPPSFRASMAEDLERGKPLELPWLSSRMRAIGAERGVATPAHDAVHLGLLLHQEGR